MRIIYFDNQMRLGVTGSEGYTAYRIKFLTPEALTLGNVTATWNASTGGVIVHRLNIIRDGHVIDVLATTKFEVIRREANLESAMLDGNLTATLQTPGLQVGDELEFAATILQHDPTLGDHSYGTVQLPTAASNGAFQTRLIWPAATPLRWQPTPDLKVPPITAKSGEKLLAIDLRDPASSIPTDEAPQRYNLRRQIQYSDFASWNELAQRFVPLFATAATLASGSAVRAEAAKIAAVSTDPMVRAQAALDLVRGQVRYVYVGLNGGNFQPASADETWKRRFGDCKGKTALLLALLNELGIAAEPVLVNPLTAGDGINTRLPSPDSFNHVIVRATVGGQRYWLDGTETGTQSIALQSPPLLGWVLPLHVGTTDLEAVPFVPAALPQLIDITEVDASAGYTTPAKYNVTRIFRGDDAVKFRLALVALPASDVDRALRAYWKREWSTIEPDKVAWRYDSAQAMLVMSLSGTGKLDWDGNASDGRNLTIYRAGFYPPPERKRPAEQDQTAPWLTDFPSFNCAVTTINLPTPAAQKRWGFESKSMDRKLGGSAYWRFAQLDANTMRTIRSRRALKPEISAADAKATNAEIEDFDNNMGKVFEEPASGANKARGKSIDDPADLEIKMRVPNWNAAIDWTSRNVPCSAPVTEADVEK